MIPKATVLLVAVGAVAMGYVVPTYLEAGWKEPPRDRLRGGVRSGVAVPAPAPVVPPEAAPVPGPTKPADPKAGPAKPKSGPAKPAATKPEAPKVPDAPRVAIVRKIEDVKLTAVRNSKPLDMPAIREVHVDIENAMTRWEPGGEHTGYDDLKHLGKDLREHRDVAFVIVPDPLVPWRQIRDMFLQGQNNYVPHAYIGVAKADEPDLLRVLPMPQCERSDAPMPEAAVFRVVLESRDGAAPVVSVDGRKIADFPADLAVAWNEWKAAHPDHADTSVPEKTCVVLEAAKTASVGHVLLVLDVLRGIGIQSERYEGGSAVRPLK